MRAFALSLRSVLDRLYLFSGILAALFLIAILVLILAVVRPMLKGLMRGQVGGAEGASPAELSFQDYQAAQAHFLGGQETYEPKRLSEYDRQLLQARALVKEDPDRVAQVIRGWVTADA